MTPLEQTFRSWDNQELFYRAWLPAAKPTRAVILFHRGHEHSGRWQATVDALKLDGFAVFAWDQRGHGRSPGDRGSAPSIWAVIKDAESWVRHLSSTYDIRMEDMAIVAQSVGAVIAAAWVHDYAPPVRCMVLGAPAFRVRLYVPLAIPMLRLKQRFLGGGYVKSYVKSKMLTSDPEEARQYDADPLIFRQIAVNILLDLFDISTRLLDDAGAITTPTLILAAGKDWVVTNEAQQRFLNRLSSTNKRMEVLEGFGHAIFHERQRRLVVDKVRNFILDCFNQPANPTCANADQAGYTKSEYDRLCTGSSLRWSAIRLLMNTGGRLSQGIRIGLRHGFDSGVMLDYVYQDKPAGFAFIGSIVDRNYLNAIGWRGIRQRRLNLQDILRQTAADLHQAGQPVRIVDIASGPGRYLLEVMTDLNKIGASALLRDYKEDNITAARDLAGQLGLSTCITTACADAFDSDSLATLSPQPTIAIISGLFELFPQNDNIRRSLKGLSQAIAPGGYLIYTCQPGTPSLSSSPAS
jgi:alpha-beta hydrolase superfamily lysophospholipase